MKQAQFFERLNNKKVKCYLCSHKCVIKDSGFGICSVRQNIDGILYSLVYGEIVAIGVDPVEKKPLYHFLPGSMSFSIAAKGCNFQCGFCQNWNISVASEVKDTSSSCKKITPEQIVSSAIENKCLSISYTYTEPTVFFEFAYDTSKIAKQRGLHNIFVTNGYMTGEVIKKILPYLSAANIDLKSFSDDFYRKHCKARLHPVLESIKLMKDLGIWIEITTLVIPGENDSEKELSKIANFIASIDINIPWHISAFFPHYKFDSYQCTPVNSLYKARQIGYATGLNYVYPGNISDEVDTLCLSCKKVLIRRKYFDIIVNRVKFGKCVYCNNPIDGVWGNVNA